ncbi:mitochondrial carrier [Irpex rosettiformis]|uniref:Mitochondrial carrier n=1 Tax=Irpex rosettiformis TaxID=378272 RepID=A0ACB8UKX4_9APHY|nr:mitochondrial carrier [Irpex rosettiformis]
MAEPQDSGHIRLVGAIAGVGSGRSWTRSILALYKGATPPAVGWAAIDSVLMGSVHNYRLFLIRQRFTETVPGTNVQRLTLVGHGIAGLGAGLTSAFLATPMEQLKIKLQMQMQRSVADRVYKGPIDCAHQIIQAKGILGLWTGFTGSLAFRANFIWMFMSFEISTGTANFLSGGLGSFAFWIMAIPADNIKNNMMASSHNAPRPTFLGTYRRIRATYGLRGFFAGLSPTILRAFPVNASAFYVYEGLMRIFNAEKTRH